MHTRRELDRFRNMVKRRGEGDCDCATRLGEGDGRFKGLELGVCREGNVESRLADVGEEFSVNG